MSQLSNESSVSSGGDHYAPTDQLLDFHPACVGYVTARHPAFCVVNRDIYVSNKLLEHLPAPIRVGRTQLRVTVKSVNQGNFRWKAVSAWPVSENEERPAEDDARPRSSSILAAVSEVPETDAGGLALEVRDAVGWVRRQLQRIKKEHEDLHTLLGADDALLTPDARVRARALVTAAHDGLTAALSAYTDISQLVGTTPMDAVTPSPVVSPSRPEPSAAGHSQATSGLGSASNLGSAVTLADPLADARREAAEAAQGSRRRSVSERLDSRALPFETDLTLVNQRLRALLSEGRVLPGTLTAAYQQRYHAVLDPGRLGFPRLNSLLKALHLPLEPAPAVDDAQLCAAMDAVLRLNGAMAADMLSARLAERGIALPGSATEIAAAYGFPVSGDMIACRAAAPQPVSLLSLSTDSQPESSHFAMSPFDPSREELFDGWGGVRPRAQSAPHPPYPTWDGDMNMRPQDAWAPQSPTHGWEQGNPATSPPRGQGQGWDEPGHGALPGSPTNGRRPTARGCTKLFVGGINPITTERTLSRYFVRFGRLVDCFIAKTPGGGLLIVWDLISAGPNFAPRSRGFGFVTFAHSSSADMVLRSGPHVLDDRALDVKAAVPKELMQTSPGQGWPGSPRGPPSPFRHGFTPDSEPDYGQ